METTFDKQTIASVDSTSDTLTPASEDTTSDTLTLASEYNTSENQGAWEFEYSDGGEADLHGQYVNCVKNPGHKNFIPVDKFRIEDLPEDCRYNEVFDYIRAVSELTVHVSVKNVSGRMMVGTGRVDLVWMYNSSKDRPCKCNKCRDSSTQVMDYATIKIKTASHVTFKDDEGEHTTCHLFFDRGNKPEECSDVITLTGTFMMHRDTIKDVCYIEHYSHDLDLAHRLKQTLTRMLELERICNKLLPPISKYKLWRDDLDKQPLLFIVSHPHGCSKQVSLGRWTSADTLSNYIVSIMYNTATCPGSSGASVCLLPMMVTSPEVDGRLTANNICPLVGVHRGISDLQRDLNLCHQEFMAVLEPTLISLEMLPMDTGPLEDFFCVMGMNDTNTHYAVCSRNPGHRNFFPLEQLSVEDLPPVNGRDEIVKCIKLVADLTVRVTVNYVSETRPETVPGTNIPYPWFSNRGSNLMRVGSGWVEYATDHYDDHDHKDCRCKECRNSPKPRRQFAWIRINTATHLVYDQLEAERTTCDLLFDSGETPGVCKDAVTLTDMHQFKSYNSCDDKCTIEFWTHNMHLAQRLGGMRQSYIRHFRELNRCDNGKSSKSVKQNGGGKTKLEPPLNIVVSHPHGCAKQVSIGHYDMPGNDGTEKVQCPTGDIICPGSSGAPVLVLPQRLLYPCCE